jgi:predicted metal-binding membrane protein
MRQISAIERLLKRDRTIVLAALFALAGLSAVYTVLGGGMGMSALAMTYMSGDMLMAPAHWTPVYAVLVFLMWWIMMIAMMLPSARPVILLYAALKRRSRDLTNPLIMTSVFLGGYLSVWALFSLAATSLQWLLEKSSVVSGMLKVSNVALGGVILIVAALYQVTPLKQNCLALCKNPVQFITKLRTPGLPGALGAGIAHGTYCVGCCAALMLLLFVGGIMNLFWIAGLSTYILLEKLLPQGRWVSYAAAAGLFVVGVNLLVSAAVME